MSQYVLENEKEAARLERMSKISAYQPATEVVGLGFGPGQKVLDAGCGSGLVAKYIANTFPKTVVEGCDLSPVRIEQAKQIRKAEGREDIRFFVSPLERIEAADNTYDFITCRYVFEFLPDPLKVLAEFRRVLKKGGVLRVIQFDGFFYNYHQTDAELTSLLKTVQERFPMDFFLGRKLPSMFLSSSFKEVDWTVSVYPFKNEDQKLECEQMRERIDFALPAFADALGSQEQAIRFRDLYCSKWTEPGSVIFYNKFLVTGSKA